MTILLGIGIVVGSGGDPVVEVVADVEVIVANDVEGTVEVDRVGSGSECRGDCDGDFFFERVAVAFVFSVPESNDKVIDGGSCLKCASDWISLFGIESTRGSGGGTSSKSSTGGWIDNGKEFWDMTGFLGLINGVAEVFV